MRRLFVDIIVNLDLFPVKLLLRIADVAHAVAHDAVDPAHHRCRRLFRGQPDLAAHDHAVRRGKGLAGHAGVRLLCQESIQNGVRDPVANLVGVTFRDGLGREYIVKAAHEEVLRWG